jgi:hypothetical protein
MNTGIANFADGYYQIGASVNKTRQITYFNVYIYFINTRCCPKVWKISMLHAKCSQ